MQHKGFTGGESVGAVEIVLLGVIMLSLLSSDKVDLNG